MIHAQNAISMFDNRLSFHFSFKSNWAKSTHEIYTQNTTKHDGITVRRLNTCFFSHKNGEFSHTAARRNGGNGFQCHHAYTTHMVFKLWRETLEGRIFSVPLVVIDDTRNLLRDTTRRGDSKSEIFVTNILYSQREALSNLHRNGGNRVANHHQHVTYLCVQNGIHNCYKSTEDTSNIYEQRRQTMPA